MGGRIEHQMTEIHCFVDDYLRARPALSGRRRSPHSSPRFADAEGITIALLQGPLGVASLKKAYRMAANNRAAGFPCLADSRASASGGISSSTACSAGRGTGSGIRSISRSCTTTWFMRAL
jgi:hypothetical protein